MLYQVADGGLAIRAGDSDYVQGAVGSMVDTTGGAGESGTRVGHLNEGNFRGGGGRLIDCDNGDRAAAQGLGNK